MAPAEVKTEKKLHLSKPEQVALALALLGANYVPGGNAIQERVLKRLRKSERFLSVSFARELNGYDSLLAATKKLLKEDGVFQMWKERDNLVAPDLKKDFNIADFNFATWRVQSEVVVKFLTEDFAEIGLTLNEVKSNEIKMVMKHLINTKTDQTTYMIALDSGLHLQIKLVSDTLYLSLRQQLNDDQHKQFVDREVAESSAFRIGRVKEFLRTRPEIIAWLRKVDPSMRFTLIQVPDLSLSADDLKSLMNEIENDQGSFWELGSNRSSITDKDHLIKVFFRQDKAQLYTPWVSRTESFVAQEEVSREAAKRLLISKLVHDYMNPPSHLQNNFFSILNRKSLWQYNWKQLIRQSDFVFKEEELYDDVFEALIAEAPPYIQELITNIHRHIDALKSGQPLLESMKLPSNLEIFYNGRTWYIHKYDNTLEYNIQVRKPAMAY